MSDPRPGDYNHPVNFPEKPRCLNEPIDPWFRTLGSCVREDGHGGPHHYAANAQRCCDASLGDSCRCSCHDWKPRGL